MKSFLIEFGLTPASRPRLASFCILPLKTHAEHAEDDPAAKYFNDGPTGTIQ